MGAAFLLVIVITEWLAERFGQHVRHGGFTKHSFDPRGGGVEAAVQRAEVQRVVGVADRTLSDAPRRLDRGDDRQQRKRIRRDRQRESAVEPALRRDDPAAAERLEHLGEVPRRDPRPFGDLLSGQRGAGGLRGEAQDCA
jgi:hypothetical protein